MTTSRPFAQVDVFSETPYLGNPVAVILDGSGLTTDDMQRIARWTNLSETTFVLPTTDDSADYRLRIFTPGGELPFAGHPTLGSAHAWLEHGGTPKSEGRVVQECGAGLVEVRIDAGRLSFAAPPTIRTGPLEPELLARIVAAYGITADQVVAHQWIDNGPGWAIVQLASAQEVLDLDPDFSLLPDDMVGAVGAHPPGSAHAFELRSFASAIGVDEDPDPVLFADGIAGAFVAGQIDHVAPAGAAGAFHAETQAQRAGCVLEIALDTLQGGGSKGNGHVRDCSLS